MGAIGSNREHLVVGLGEQGGLQALTLLLDC
jgi:hypothetical protein